MQTQLVALQSINNNESIGQVAMMRPESEVVARSDVHLVPGPSGQSEPSGRGENQVVPTACRVHSRSLSLSPNHLSDPVHNGTFIAHRPALQSSSPPVLLSLDMHSNRAVRIFNNASLSTLANPDQFYLLSLIRAEFLRAQNSPTTPNSVDAFSFPASTSFSQVNPSPNSLSRTMSNGSTFGPIPSWSSILQKQGNVLASNEENNIPESDENMPDVSEDDERNESSQAADVASVASLQAAPLDLSRPSTFERPTESSKDPIIATYNPDTHSLAILPSALPLVFGESYVLTNEIEASNLYRCVNVKTNEEYCAKVVLSCNHREFLAPHAHMQDHAGINPVRKIVVSRQHTFIFFPPNYGDLHSYVRSRRFLRENEAMPLFKQIVQIVADCHSQGITLRDLKLRKFIFSNKERTQLKLETLEGAQIFENDDDTLFDKHGCPAYVSPEVLNLNAYSGRAADCWSLGVILYTMLVGRYPFHDTNPSMVFIKIRRGTYHIPDSLSKQARSLILSLIKVNHEQRLKADDALCHRWFHSNFKTKRPNFPHPYSRQGQNLNNGHYYHLALAIYEPSSANEVPSISSAPIPRPNSSMNRFFQNPFLTSARSMQNSLSLAPPALANIQSPTGSVDTSDDQVVPDLDNQ